MATITQITTGEQTVTSTGAITGSADTSAMTLPCTIKCRIRGFAAAKNIAITIEDTANASAFSEAVTVAEFQFSGMGTTNPPGTEQYQSIQGYQVPLMRYGATNNKLRANCVAITGSATGSVLAWIEN